jgi:hypothetical protein
MPKFFDTLLVLPDAILRVGSVTSGLELVHNHKDDRISDSLVLRLLIGAVASAGGGVTAATFGVWNPEWRFSTPSYLRPGNMMSILDVWAGSLMGMLLQSLLYSITNMRSSGDLRRSNGYPPSIPVVALELEHNLSTRGPAYSPRCKIRCFFNTLHSICLESKKCSLG